MSDPAGGVRQRQTGPMKRFHEILLLIGQLNYTWTNTESLLIYLIAGLANVDKETAVIIFLTLNTTRARIELVERFAKMAKTPSDRRHEILAVTQQLGRQAKLRNKYSHCIYSFDETGDQASTQLMAIFDSKETIKYGKIEQIDDAELARISEAIDQIMKINKGIWDIVERHSFPR
ncbi:hypothetical protein ABIE78_006437 [Sinorhizobium fredii]|jgi:hypothetical protein|uniref:Uncharacterized protein n=1 Tax=Sinorhizobium fredii (strain USDA 257) TaxID=1185652 RepID=I3XDI5_SINF2|nr:MULTISPECIES: hypothetical protein [Sinorhizobium]AFL53941.1 hypothetical protein USDA257_c54180 [Sinorhizobium fredii USDA 257]PDT79991.1 hypothetical protein CO676_30035 [Sinorhizobium sp. BJ1]